MSGTTENIPHRILFSRIPRDITDLISLLLHFSHCSRHRNMSFRSLFFMHGYEHNKCFPFSNRKVFGSVHWRTLSWTLSWTLMPHTGSDSRLPVYFFPACGKGSVCFFQSCQQSFWRQDLKGKRFVDTTVFSGPSDLHSSNSGIFIIFVIQLISTRTDFLSIYSYGY